MQGPGQKWVEDRKSVIDDPYGEKKVQKRRDNDPPAVEDPGTPHTRPGRNYRCRHVATVGGFHALAKLGPQDRAYEIGTTRMCVLAPVHSGQGARKVKALLDQKGGRPGVVSRDV